MQLSIKTCGLNTSIPSAYRQGRFSFKVGVFSVWQIIGMVEELGGYRENFGRRGRFLSASPFWRDQYKSYEKEGF